MESELDCSGADSGREECWPTWVNIGVPIIMSIAFLVVLAIMFFVWPKRPQRSDEEHPAPVYRQKEELNNHLEMNFTENNQLTCEKVIISENSC
jgi:hypothetical protein